MTPKAKKTVRHDGIKPGQIINHNGALFHVAALDEPDPSGSTAASVRRLGPAHSMSFQPGHDYELADDDASSWFSRDDDGDPAVAKRPTMGTSKPAN